jgi:hypothetical protein
VCGKIVSSPAADQCGNARTELIEEITQLKALLRVERNISHAAAVYEGPKAAALPMVDSDVSDRNFLRRKPSTSVGG